MPWGRATRIGAFGTSFHALPPYFLTQARAAKLMGIKQPDVSNLVRGRFRGYSIERLLTLLRALDQDIEIVIRDKPKSKRPARLVVRVAA